MTLTEFLQKLVVASESGNSVGFILTQIIGDPDLVYTGQVWVAQGYADLSGDSEMFQSTTTLSQVSPDSSYPPSQVILSLYIKRGIMTINRVSGFDSGVEDELQLQYFNGVLYGTGMHRPNVFKLPLVSVGPALDPGPVFTVAFQLSIIQ